MAPGIIQGGDDVMGSLDDAEFVIADLGREDAWLSVEEGDAPIVADWA
ncbi:hypothetical protein [Halolamina sp.]|jgi:hypothetical protein